jgi:hypothetical protein
MALRPVAPPPYAAPPPVDPMNAGMNAPPQGPPPPPYMPGSGQPPWAPNVNVAPPPPPPSPGGAAPDYSQPGGEAPFGGTPYWSGVMRNYIDMITKPQATPRPAPLDNSQIAAYMLNPGMRGELMNMYNTPYQAAIAQARSHEEMIGHGLTGAAHMLSAAGEYEQRQHEDARETAQRNYSSAKTAAESGDVTFDYKAAGAPELYSVAQQRAQMFGTIHNPETKPQVEERNRKEWYGRLDKLQSQLNDIQAARDKLQSNPNLAFLLDPEKRKGNAGYGTASNLEKSINDRSAQLDQQEADIRKEMDALRTMSPALGPHGEPSTFERYNKMSGPEQEQYVQKRATVIQTLKARPQRPGQPSDYELFSKLSPDQQDAFVEQFVKGQEARRSYATAASP